MLPVPPIVEKSFKSFIEAPLHALSNFKLTVAQSDFVYRILKERMDGSFGLRLLFRGTRDGMKNYKFH